MRRLLFLINFLMICCVPTIQAEEQFPFLGEISTNDVNIRAGQNANFEILFQASKGQPLVVEGRQYSWLKVRLPSNAKAYVSSQYIRLINDEVGEVVADRLNVRAAPDVNATSIGQISSGDKVRILKKANDQWLQILPFGPMYGWVAENFVKFKSLQIPVEEPIVLLDDAEPSEILPESPAVEAVIPAVEESIAVVEPVHVVGYVEAINHVRGGNGTGLEYKLTVDGQTLYLLKGRSGFIAGFEFSKVVVEGVKEETDAQPAGSPAIINIQKIQFVL